MKKLALIAVLVALLGTSVAYALETTTYNFVASSTDTIIPFVTYRDGKAIASASYRPSNHGLYSMKILDSIGHILCWETYDFRWGRSPTMPMICNSDEYAAQYYTGGLLPSGVYTVIFRAAMGGKTAVVLDVTAETNP